MKTEIMRLRLVSPLVYFKHRGEAFCRREKTTAENFCEELFCFEINPAEAAEFEPDKNSFLGDLIFSGIVRPENSRENGTVRNATEKVELPRGSYIFTQTRDFPPKSDILEMAVELQKEGLWQRLEPGKRLYLRYLFEDGSGVTQIMRPCVLPF